MRQCDLKQKLLANIKHAEWRKTVDEEDYNRKCNLIEKAYKKSVVIISKENKNFKKSRTVTKYTPPSGNVSAKALKAYEEWKKQQKQTQSEYPEVSVRNLLLLLYYLNTESDAPKTRQECFKRQNATSGNFWDSPSFIGKMIRRCILTRNWSNMTYYLLILLRHDRRYLSFVKNVCKIMVKYNPLIRRCGFEEQFNMILGEQETMLMVV